VLGRHALGVRVNDMDGLPLTEVVVSKIWWLIPIFLASWFLRSAWLKGQVGELKIRLLIWLRLDSDAYKVLHNLTLPTPDGTTQVDHVLVSRFGIFVIETKNMSGWIFGDARRRKWTQTFHRNKYTFQNPIQQNFKHVKAVQAVVEIPEHAIHSVVVFTGSSEFRTALPDNVTTLRTFRNHIMSKKIELIPEDQVNDVISQLQQARRKPGLATNTAHIKHLKRQTGQNGAPACPRCGNEMALRTAKRGNVAGNQFWGCTAFPKCRATKAYQ